jgi:hypothetical protein
MNVNVGEMLIYVISVLE